MKLFLSILFTIVTACSFGQMKTDGVRIFLDVTDSAHPVLKYYNPSTGNKVIGAGGGSLPFSKFFFDSLRINIAKAGDTLIINPINNINVFNIKDYGAKGDNSTNDITAINNAVDAAVAKGGGIVFFPSGIYLTSQAVKLRSNVTYLGENSGNTIIKAKSNSVDNVMGEAYPDPALKPFTHVVIENLTIDGNSSNVSYNTYYGGTTDDAYQNGIRLDRFTNCMIRNCIIQNTVFNGLSSYFYSWDNIYENNTFLNIGKSTNTTGPNSYHAIFVEFNNMRTTIRGNVIKGTRQGGIFINTGSDGISSPRADNLEEDLTIENNKIYNTTNSAISVVIGNSYGDINKVKIINNTIDSITDGSSQGIEIRRQVITANNDIRNIVVSGNQISKAKNRAILIWDITNVLVNNNTTTSLESWGASFKNISQLELGENCFTGFEGSFELSNVKTMRTYSGDLIPIAGDKYNIGKADSIFNLAFIDTINVNHANINGDAFFHRPGGSTFYVQTPSGEVILASNGANVRLPTGSLNVENGIIKGNGLFSYVPNESFGAKYFSNKSVLRIRPHVAGYGTYIDVNDSLETQLDSLTFDAKVHTFRGGKVNMEQSLNLLNTVNGATSDSLLVKTPSGEVRKVAPTPIQNTAPYQLEGATPTFSKLESTTAYWDLVANSTLSIINVNPGDNITIKITQDGTGGHTLTLPSNSHIAEAATINTAANSVSILKLDCYDGTDWYWSILKNY